MAAIEPAVGPHQGHPGVSVLMAGFVDAHSRDGIAAGNAPRVDVLELEARYGWRILDFGWLLALEREHRSMRVAGTVFKRTLGWSWWLAINARWATRGDRAVYCTGEDVGIPAAILSRLTGRRGPRIITRIEKVTVGSSPLRRRLYRGLFRVAYPTLSRVLCRTQALVDEIAADGLPVDRAAFVPETTDTRFFTPLAASPPQCRPEYLPSGPYILSAGLELRDYSTLVEAVRGTAINVVIAAGSPWSKLAPGIAQEGAPTNVVVAAYTRPQMRELYRAAALVVVPVIPTPRACGMNVVLEAWATGKVVVASDTAGLRSYICDGENGFLVTPCAPSALRAALTAILEDTEDTRAVARRAQDHVTRCLSIDHYVQTVHEIVDEESGQMVAGVRMWSPEMNG
jgi:glycosyltransferase involved in cell wall biosynthesis